MGRTPRDSRPGERTCSRSSAARTAARPSGLSRGSRRASERPATSRSTTSTSETPGSRAAGGCFRCIAEGEAFCPVHDGRDDLLDRLDACDGAIFASPNYVQNVSGLYKTFVDRFAWICHRPRFYPKPALAVATSAGPFGLKETLAAIQIGPATWGFVFVDEVGVAVLPRLGAGAESRRRRQRRSTAPPSGWRVPSVPMRHTGPSAGGSSTSGPCAQ